jgi:hypothetical protein|nr:hypothetical protein [Nanoarchaeum sp.]
MINSKKGQSLSVNTIIITLLALFVLIILVVALTGNTGNFMDNINQLWSGTAIDTQKAVVSCNGLCSSFTTSGTGKFKTDFCNKIFKIDTDGDKKADVELTCPEIQTVSCAAISEC